MKGLTISVLVLIAIVGIVFLIYNFSQQPLNTAGVINNPEPALEVNVAGGAAPAGNVIEITPSGFSPSELTVSKGTTVTWVNKDTEEHWPASATHPIHTDYRGGSYDEPGSYQGSLACRSEGVTKTGAFDACHGLSPGESFSFTFNEVGTWNYHEHLDISFGFGKVIVQ